MKNKISFPWYCGLICMIIAIPIYLILVCAFADNEMSEPENNPQPYSFVPGLAQFLRIHSSDFYYRLAQHDILNNSKIDQLKLQSLDDDQRKIYLYTLAARSNPLDYLSRIELASLLWKHSYSKEAVLKLFQDTCFIYPVKDKHWLALALFYSTNSQMQESLQYFLKAAEINNDDLPLIYDKLQFAQNEYLKTVTPRNYVSLMHLANYYVKKKDYPSAAKIYKEAFDFADSAQKIKIIQGLMNIKELEQAFKLLQISGSRMNDDPDYHWLKALYYINKNNAKEFSAEIDAGMKMASIKYLPGSTEMNNFMLRIADTFLNFNMINMATIYYSKVLTLDVYNSKASMGMARIYFQQDDLHRAFVYASHAEDSPANYQFILAVFKRALVKGNETAIDEIIKVLKERKTTEAWGYFARALYYKNQGDYASAVPNIESTLQLEPENEAFLKEAGAIYALMYDDNAAFKYWEKLLVLKPQDIAQDMELYRLYIHEGKIEKAKSMCLFLAEKSISFSECQILIK